MDHFPFSKNLKQRGTTPTAELLGVFTHGRGSDTIKHSTSCKFTTERAKARSGRNLRLYWIVPNTYLCFFVSLCVHRPQSQNRYGENYANASKATLEIYILYCLKLLKALKWLPVFLLLSIWIAWKILQINGLLAVDFYKLLFPTIERCQIACVVAVFTYLLCTLTFAQHLPDDSVNVFLVIHVEDILGTKQKVP